MTTEEWARRCTSNTHHMGEAICLLCAKKMVEDREKKWKEYLGICLADVEDMLGVALVHGWSSPSYRIEAGKRLRKELGLGGEDMSQDEYKVGTPEWWLKEQIHGRYGIIHRVLDLVEGNHISIMKGVELIEALFKDREAGRIHDTLSMSAPWNDLGT